jgi:hypothetical protein
MCLSCCNLGDPIGQVNKAIAESQAYIFELCHSLFRLYVQVLQLLNVGRELCLVIYDEIDLALKIVIRDCGNPSPSLVHSTSRQP